MKNEKGVKAEKIRSNCKRILLVQRVSLSNTKSEDVSHYLSS